MFVSLLFPILIVFLTALISFLNYTPGTFLTGWDTLHPEFNFAQNFSNLFFGVFRTDQGLGAVAAHSHMSELPRVTLLWLFSFAFPLSFLRYSIFFLSFILGPLGVYFFTKRILDSHNNLTIEQPNNFLSLAGFLGALVYIFNLGTVQHFYVPFEMFAVQYAALPWIFLLALKYIESPRAKNLFLFALVTFLASPMAYASLLWYAYFAALFLFLFVFWTIKRTKKVFLAGAILILATLAVNAYWLLPNLYFLSTSAQNVSLAQVNKIFSDEAFAYNKQYGNLFDVALLRNFLFSWTEQINTHTFRDLMLTWKIHLQNPFVLYFGYAVFAFSIFGIFVSIIKRAYVAIALLPIFIFSLIMVMNMNPPFEPLFLYIRENFAIAREGLRFPFTKFSILLMFSMSVFTTISFSQVFKILSKKYFKNFIPLFVLVSIASLLWYGLPMFSGNLINQSLRIKIPSKYFELFEYMKEQPQGARVAILPIHSPWGWEYYDWGYQGAGFIWFGLKQPVLARDFDRWNASNEQYFREMSHALYSRDVKKIEALALKYRISFFLLDEGIIFPNNKPNALWHYETKDTFSRSKNIKLVKKFGDLSLYGVYGYLTGAEYVQKPRDITYVGGRLSGGFTDTAIEDLGDYIVSDSDPDFVYFSRSLVDRYDRVEPSNISFLNDKLLLKLGKNSGYSLSDKWKSDDIFPEFMRKSYDRSTEEQGLPFIAGDEQFIFFPASGEQINISDSLKELPCQSSGRPPIEKVAIYKDYVSFRAKRGASCGFITFPTAKQDFGSFIIIEARNQTGLPARICISENITDRCGIYTALDQTSDWKKYVFMIPPQASGANGYAVHFNTIGIGDDESVNDVRAVRHIQIPYYRISNLSFVKSGYVPRPNGISTLETREINPALYRADVSFRKNQKGLIAFYKAYDPGWKAYSIQNSELRIKNYLNMVLPFLFGRELKQHVEVNSWANGWILNEERIKNNEERIIIVYLPQYLEYLGFGMLIALFVYLIFQKTLKTRKNQTI